MDASEQQAPVAGRRTGRSNVPITLAWLETLLGADHPGFCTNY